jgi:hypothetical protein
VTCDCETVTCEVVIEESVTSHYENFEATIGFRFSVLWLLRTLVFRNSAFDLREYLFYCSLSLKSKVRPLELWSILLTNIRRLYCSKAQFSGLLHPRTVQYYALPGAQARVPRA